ncbi:MAG: dTDP-4-dehydrorhamnose reductase [Clostridia bacterium]|nr:dTDP-4-dehydrorhamnose reductase [Clostridia bacterium]
MRIMITGAKGQLASEIIGIIRAGECEIGKIDPIYKYSDLICVDIDKLDITNEKAVGEFITRKKPDILINCAAMTNVDACETNLELAMKVNALGPKNLSIACEKVGAKLVHISTDYVFSGDEEIAYCEWDACNPQSIYGKSKLLGEFYVRENTCKYFIIRTAWLYSRVGENFVKTMIKLGKEKSSIKVVNDQKGNPTYANDLAYHILKVAQTEQYGIYHCTGEGECSWYDFAKEIMRLASLDCEVIPCPTGEFPRPAKRPGFSSLNNLMLKSTVGNKMRIWQDALESFIKKI